MIQDTVETLHATSLQKKGWLARICKGLESQGLQPRAEDVTDYNRLEVSQTATRRFYSRELDEVNSAPSSASWIQSIFTSG